jgi:hypothetical protein
MIVQNTQEVFHLGKFNDLIEAERYAFKNAERLSHSEPWIIVDDRFSFGSSFTFTKKLPDVEKKE